MITAKDVVAKVRELAAESPDFVYPTASRGNDVDCFYLPDERFGQPACIFGQALLALGADREVLARADSNPIGTPVNALLGDLGVIKDDDSADWFWTVQSKQDTRTPWGEAVWVADKAAIRRGASL